MKKWKQLLMALALVVGISGATLSVSDVSAINVFKACSGTGSSQVCSAQGTDNATSMAQTIVSTMLLILGILAVIMIIYSGIKYVISAGDASKIKSAKDTLTYSIVGLIVAVLAYAIVNFVVTKF
jgi:hypothetical protein